MTIPGKIMTQSNKPWVTIQNSYNSPDNLVPYQERVIIEGHKTIKEINIRPTSPISILMSSGILKCFQEHHFQKVYGSDTE